jgi:hypothetical protein
MMASKPTRIKSQKIYSGRFMAEIRRPTVLHDSIDALNKIKQKHFATNIFK